MSKHTLIAELKQRVYSGDLSFHDDILARLLIAEADNLPPLDRMFHAAFRQRDITKSGYLDMAIWKLLEKSNQVWDIIASHIEYKETPQ